MNNQQNGNNKSDLRYLGKIKQQTFQKSDGSGSFQKFTIMLDNPNPANQDGTPNSFHKGVLVWFDAETGKRYQVKQLDVAGVSDRDQSKGFINSLRIALGNEYHVTEL